MVNYLNILINTFRILHQSMYIKQGLLFYKKIIYPE